MGIGYGRAARLIDFMAEDGYVGPYNGSKAREVMLTPEQWENIQAGDPNPVNDEDWPDEEQGAENVAAEDKVTLKPRKLERIEPGQSVHLSANVSFAPKNASRPRMQNPSRKTRTKRNSIRSTRVSSKPVPWLKKSSLMTLTWM